MKNLQDNFTTPEQSKRLLELGVPADSADLYYHPKYRRNEKGAGYWSKPRILEDGHTLGYEQSYSAYYDLLPCWSVGRLIEIYEICVGERFERRIEKSTLKLIPLMDDVLFQIKEHTRMLYRRLDFSKLEE